MTLGVVWEVDGGEVYHYALVQLVWSIRFDSRFVDSIRDGWERIIDFDRHGGAH